MWEYKVITWIGGNLEVLLNEMGSQGWDLCGIKGDDFIFKRGRDTDTSTETDINPYYPYYPYYPYCPVTPYYTNPPYTVTSGTSGTITASPANTTSTTI